MGAFYGPHANGKTRHTTHNNYPAYEKSVNLIDSRSESSETPTA